MELRGRKKDSEDLSENINVTTVVRGTVFKKLFLILLIN